LRQVPVVSVVVPMLNEAKILPELIGRLHAALDSCTPDYEIIFVDGGFTDESPSILSRAARNDARVRRQSAAGLFSESLKTLNDQPEMRSCGARYDASSPP
jgi:glycosyltransferase involved in cell wall biosynthesis